MKKGLLFGIALLITIWIADLFTFCVYPASNPGNPTYTVDSLTIGLVAYYPFRGSYVDASGNGNNGSPYGTGLSYDRLYETNSAALFDGTTSYIDVKDNTALRLSNTDFSINAWVELSRYNTANNSIIISKRGTASNSGYALSVSDVTVGNNVTTGQLIFEVSGAADPHALSVNTVPLNKWVMVTAVYNLKKQQLSFYINGVLDSILTNIPSPIATGTADLFIGNDNPNNGTGYGFNGYVDDIRIFNRQLSATDVIKLHNMANS